MKMNDTVYRIVEIMFQDVEMNDEVRALHDEVMNNCQERYEDMVASGMKEDDAVAAVVESLRGLEDVISQYSRRKPGSIPQADAPVEAAGENACGVQDMVFHASEVKQISLTMVHEDVTVEPSSDADYHVCWNRDTDPAIVVKLNGGTLRIEHSKTEAAKGHEQSAGAENGHVDVKIETLEDLFDSVGKLMGRVFGKGGVFSRSLNFGSDGVTVYVPRGQHPAIRLVTTSGDVDVTHVTAGDLNVVSVSGDISVAMKEDAPLPQVTLSTTSGDVDATAFAGCFKASSTSGDVEIEGRVDSLTVSTISGDIDVRADAREVNFKAISGDVDLILDSLEIRNVEGSTISGDVDLCLPRGLGCMAIQTASRSGDVLTNYGVCDAGPTVAGKISTMSGDISIR